MKFAQPFLALAAIAAAADSSNPIDVIKAQLANVINTTQILTKEIANFEGLQQAVTLLAANTNALQAVQNGTKAILATSQVPLADTLQLTPSVLQLAALVNQSISTTIAKKPVFVNASIGGVTYMSLQQLSCASDQFSNATLQRLPGGGIAAASNELTAPIRASFKLGLAAYQDQAANNSAPANCTTVDSTSAGLAAVDRNGAGILATSTGMTVTVAAVLAGLMMI